MCVCVAKPFNRILKPNCDANVEPFKHLNQPRKAFLWSLAETDFKMWKCVFCAFFDRNAAGLSYFV